MLAKLWGEQKILVRDSGRISKSAWTRDGGKGKALKTW
jgi:hypothetical protein